MRRCVSTCSWNIKPTDVQHLPIAHWPACSSKPPTPRKPLQKAEAGWAFPHESPGFQALKPSLWLAFSSWFSLGARSILQPSQPPHPRSQSAAPLPAVLRWCSLLISSRGGVSPCHPDPIQSFCLMNSWHFINKRYPSVIKAILQSWISCEEKQNWSIKEMLSYRL